MKRKKQGFTLTETLAAVLILTLLTGVIAMGASAASGMYSKLLFTSESDLLASTLNTALGDVLHYATDVETGEEAAVSAFTNRNYGVARGHLLNTGGKLYLNTADVPDDAEGATLLTLVSDGAYTSLKVREFSLAYADGLFTGGYTIVGRDEQLQKPIAFAFRALNGPAGPAA